MSNEPKPLYSYSATSFVTLTSDELKTMRDELERLRGIEARVRAMYDAYLEDGSPEPDEALEMAQLWYYLTGEGLGDSES